MLLKAQNTLLRQQFRNLGLWPSPQAVTPYLWLFPFFEGFLKAKVGLIRPMPTYFQSLWLYWSSQQLRSSQKLWSLQWFWSSQPGAEEQKPPKCTFADPGASISSDWETFVNPLNHHFHHHCQYHRHHPHLLLFTWLGGICHPFQSSSSYSRALWTPLHQTVKFSF